MEVLFAKKYIVYITSFSYELVIATKFGSISINIFLPRPSDNIQFNFDKSSTIWSVDSNPIIESCILSTQNDLIESYVVWR